MRRTQLRMTRNFWSGVRKCTHLRPQTALFNEISHAYDQNSFIKRARGVSRRVSFPVQCSFVLEILNCPPGGLIRNFYYLEYSSMPKEKERVKIKENQCSITLKTNPQPNQSLP